MLNKKVDQVLENLNKDYLFLIAAEKEAQRLRNLPRVIKEQFKKHLCQEAIEHVATDNIPEYTLEDIEDETEEVIES